MTDKKDLGALIRELWVEDHKHVNKQHMPNNAGVLLAFAAERRHVQLIQTIQESTERILAALSSLQATASQVEDHASAVRYNTEG